MLLRTGGAVLGARLLQALANAAVGWLVARELGPTGQGRYALTLLLALVGASVANGGVGLAAVPRLKRAPGLARAVLSSQLRWVLAVVPALAAVTALAWRAGLADALRGAAGWTTPWAPVAALVAAASLLLFDVTVQDLTALGRVPTGPRINLLRAVLHLGLAAALAATGSLDLPRALAVWAGAQAVAALLVLRALGRAAPPATAAPPPPARRLVREGWVGQLSTLASLLHLRLDLALVAAWHGPAVVGVYSVAVLAGEVLWMLPGALQPVLVYTAGGSAAGGDRLTARALRLGTLVTAVAALALAWAAPRAFALLFQGEYDASVAALRALLPGIVAFAPGAVLAGDFIGRGRAVWNTQASVATVLVNVAAGVAWIPDHGAVGAAWASSVAYAAGSLVMLLRFRHASGLGWGRLLLPRPADFRGS